MPYRIDIPSGPPDVLDLLIDLGALDVASTENGWAAVLPDAVTPDVLREALGMDHVQVSEATPRDSESVWLLEAQPVQVGRFLIAPPNAAPAPTTLRLQDTEAFGSGHHPTTALCIEALDEMLSVEPVDALLDVGTGSGILALVALKLGVSKATGIDIDPSALPAAKANARLNQLTSRLKVSLSGPGEIDGTWPVVVANILASPLMEMAPDLVRRVGPRGRLLLSGMSDSLEPEVRRAYERRGLRHVMTSAREGWAATVMQASW